MLALAMISEGDHKQLKRAVKSVYNYVDRIYITTTKVNKPQWKDPKIVWSFYKWDDNFANARNYNWQQVQEPFTLWMDSDDVIEHAEVLPEVVEEMQSRALDAVFVTYNYRRDAQGNVVIEHPRERIVRTNFYTWKGALHETLISPRSPRTMFIKDFEVDHYSTDENDGLERNYRILHKEYEKQRKAVLEGIEEEIDPRVEYYLGRVLYDKKDPQSMARALNLFQDYVQHSGWDEERASAWDYIGNILFNAHNYDEAIDAYLTAIKEKPHFPSWHLHIARAYLAQQDYDRAEHHLKVGMSMEQPRTSMILTPTEDKKTALVCTYYIMFHKAKFDEALKAAKMLYDIEPNQEYKDKIDGAKKMIKWTAWGKAVAGMSEQLAEDGEHAIVNRLVAAVPQALSNTALMSKVLNEYGVAKEYPKNSVVIYAAIDTLSWTPQSLKTGLGGSESSIYYLAKNWQEMGYHVTVYTNCGKDEGTYDGVEYLNFQRFNFKARFDILISWRNPHFIARNLLDARITLLDLHDVPQPEDYDEDLLRKLDFIMVKSEAHRDLLPQVPDEKFQIIPNGIDLEKLNQVKADRVPQRCFYGSSYDRGLEGLLEIWPEVRQAHPNAELHIAYGWDLFDKLRSHVPHLMAWKKRMQGMMKQEGVFEHGKLGHDELYQLAKSCSYFTYPSTFYEIDCITARYSQALGLLPVTNTYAALATTVQRGVRCTVDHSNPQKTLTEYKQALIKALKTWEADKTDYSSWDWKEIAQRWVQVFNSPIEQDVKLTIFTPTIRSGFWNIMAENLSRQTYQNFEWLIVDDYPEDRKHIADKYAKKYNLDIRYMRGKLDKSKYNYALIQADNQAIFSAKGSLIVWLQDFILIPYEGLERMVWLHKKYPNCLIAPVDKYYQMKKTPDIENKEDWFDGDTDVIGKFMRKNARIQQQCLRYSDNPFEFEMNIGAIPTSIARKLNGLWEFQDDGLGFNNTDIAFRALKAGFGLIVDERLSGVCLDHWKPLLNHPENVKDREWNLNDARYLFLENMTLSGKLPLIRNSSIDRKIRLENNMPKGLSQDEAAEWIRYNSPKLAKQWEKEWDENK